MVLRHQIVRIVNNNTLVTADLRANPYTTEQGRLLTPGIYMVLWPSYIKTPLYNGDARYVGPFKTIDHARHLVRLCVTEYFLEKRAPATARRGEILFH